jgi:XisH protein
MAARDAFHGAVKQGLIKDGWTITHDPYTLSVDKIDMYIDLGAEKLLAAEKGNDYIAVEIKSFLGPSAVTEYHAALGQFLNYRFILEEQEDKRKLYLAVPIDTYTSFFSLTFPRMSVKKYNLSLVVYDTKKEVIVEWIN